MLEHLPIAVDLSWASSLVERGGPVVIILLVMSIASLTVAIVKFIQFVGLGVGRNRGVEAAVATWIGGRREHAAELASRRNGPTARTLAHAMRATLHGFGEGYVREDAERVASRSLAALRSHLRVIEATAQLAPLLGLFGTVLGMMSAFQALQTAGSDADPAALAGGIWIALITTAVGLAVAIPASGALYWFDGRIERERENMEAALTSVFTGQLQNRFHAGDRPSNPVLQGSARDAAE